MPTKNLLGGLFCVCLFGFASAAISQEDYKVPRTEYGLPDLQGVWNYASNIPLEKPEVQVKTTAGEKDSPERDQSDSSTSQQAPRGVGGYNEFWFENGAMQQNARDSIIVYPENGRFPPLASDAKTQVGDASGVTEIPGMRPVKYTVGGISNDGPEDRGLSERCIVGFNSGPPFIPSLYNNNIQIIQNKDYAVVITEMIHDARIVPITDHPDLDDGITLWTGNSRGYFDGDTLVVETRNFNGLTGSITTPGTAYGNSSAKKLTEKFTRVSSDTVLYEFTVDDPETFTDKIVGLILMTKVDGQMYEYACHEGNYGLASILRGARMLESLAKQSD